MRVLRVLVPGADFFMLEVACHKTHRYTPEMFSLVAECPVSVARGQRGAKAARTSLQSCSQ